MGGDWASMRVRTYEVTREIPRSQNSFLITEIVEAVKKFGYKLTYKRAMKKLDREEKIFARRDKRSLEISITGNKLRFFFRFPSDEIDEEHGWKLDRETDRIISAAFDTDLLRSILHEVKLKVEVKRHVFKWLAMTIYAFVFLSSFFLCFPIVAEFLLNLSNPSSVESFGRYIVMKNVIPSVDITFDISVWFLNSLVVIGLLCVYFLIIYEIDLSFIRLLESIETRIKKIHSLRHSFIRERVIQETGVLVTRSQKRGALCVVSWTCLIIAAIPVYSVSTRILSVMLFWTGFFTLISVMQIFDFNTSLPEYSDRLRFGSKISTLFYIILDTFPALTWGMFLFNPYVTSLTFHQVDFRQFFYLGLYWSCLIAIVSVFAIYLLESALAADPFESLISVLITLTIANLASIPSPPLLDPAKDLTGAFTILNLLISIFNFLLLKVFPLIALGMLFVKRFTKLRACTHKPFRKHVQNIILSFTKKKAIEISLLLLAMGILSLKTSERSLDALNTVFIVGIIVPATLISYFLISKKSRVMKIRSYMVDYARLSHDRVKIQRTRALVQHIWLIVGLIGLILPFLSVLYHYS